MIEAIFHASYRSGAEEVAFERDDFIRYAKELNIDLPRNLGDIIYSFRYRTTLPQSILDTAPSGKTWIIRSAGRGRYRFELVADTPLAPNPNLAVTKVPDAAPGIIAKYAFSDEQAVLALARYNRLIDIFLGIACYSLQNHLRTTVRGLGQVETDEIYVGLDRNGAHYVLFLLMRLPMRTWCGIDAASWRAWQRRPSCDADRDRETAVRGSPVASLDGRPLLRYRESDGWVRSDRDYRGPARVPRALAHHDR